MTGTVEGVALAPGVSLNNRLYTKSNIAKAYERLSARLADPNGSPVIMRTHHAAGDDSTRIVAQLKSVALTPEGAMTYKGAFANTDHAQTIRALAKAEKGAKPNLAHVSIYGWWIGEPETKTLEDGTTVETADDLEIDAIDFTASPGVLAASARAESRHAHAIHESHDAEITVTEAQTATITTDPARFIDPGYKGEKRLPIDTIEHVQGVWAYLATEAKKTYTTTQIKRMKARVRTEARKLGATVENSWVIAGGPVDKAKVGESYYDSYAMGFDPASFCFSATNGPIRAEISSWCIDPADLEVVMTAVVAAISQALKALDPDMDGDIDLPGAPSEDTDDSLTGGDQMETAPKLPADQVGETEAATAAADHQKEALMSEATKNEAAATETAAAPAAPAIDYDLLAESLLNAQEKRAAAKEAAEAAAAAETASAETATVDKAQLREGLKDVVRELLVEDRTGVTPSRKGHGLSETTEAGASPAELFEKRGELLFAAMRENAGR